MQTMDDETQAILEVLEELGAFSEEERELQAAYLAHNTELTAELLREEEWTLDEVRQWGLAHIPSRVLHRALSKLRLRWVAPEAGDVICDEGQTVEFRVCTSHGRGNAQYRWYKNGQLLEGQVTDTLLLEHLEANDAGSYSFSVTDGPDKVQPAQSVWELGVHLQRPFGQLDDHEKWYHRLDLMMPRPHFTMERSSCRVILPEIGLEVLLPMYYSSTSGYIVFKVTADGPEKNNASIIPCSNFDFLQDVIELRTFMARPLERERLLDQKGASPTLLRNYIKILGGDPPEGDADALLQYIAEKYRDGDPLVPVDLVEGRTNVRTDRSQFLVGSSGVFGKAYGPPKALPPAPAPTPPAPAPAFPEGGLDTLVPKGQLSRESIMRGMERIRTEGPATVAAAEVQMSSSMVVQPPPKVHTVAVQGAAMSMGISFGIELVRSGYFYQRGRISGKEAAKQIGITTGTGGLLAGSYTYASYGLSHLATRQAGNVIGRAASKVLANPNATVGVVLVSIAACVDLYRWKKGLISGRQLRENLVANAASTAASTLAVTTASAALGAALATSWTGIGFLVLLGIGVAIVVDKGVRKGVRWAEKQALLRRMHVDACGLLGVPHDNPALYQRSEVVAGRFRSLSRYLHPDVANSKSCDITAMFNLMLEAKQFLLKPSTEYDLLLNFQGSSVGSNSQSTDNLDTA